MPSSRTQASPPQSLWPQSNKRPSALHSGMPFTSKTMCPSACSKFLLESALSSQTCGSSRAKSRSLPPHRAIVCGSKAATAVSDSLCLIRRSANYLLHCSGRRASLSQRIAKCGLTIAPPTKRICCAAYSSRATSKTCPPRTKTRRRQAPGAACLRRLPRHRQSAICRLWRWREGRALAGN